MHIAEGVLSAPVLIAGGCLAAAGVAWGLKKLPEEKLMGAGLIGAAFFVASLVHVPVGVGNAHLILNGLAGALLGPAAFPVIFVALLLQGIIFGFGGLTVIGVNTLTMGASAVAAGWVFRRFASPDAAPSARTDIAAFASGALGVLLASLFTAAALAFSDEGFVAAAAALLAIHLPIAAAEGIITALSCRFISRAAPQLFRNDRG